MVAFLPPVRIRGILLVGVGMVVVVVATRPIATAASDTILHISSSALDLDDQ